MANVKGDGARGPKKGLFGRLGDFVRDTGRKVARAFGVSPELQQTPKPDSRSGPVPEALKQALRHDLARRIPHSWFTKKRTPGVVATYAATLREMGPNSRHWCRVWFGDERPYLAGKLKARKRRERKARRQAECQA